MIRDVYYVWGWLRSPHGPSFSGHVQIVLFTGSSQLNCLFNDSSKLWWPRKKHLRLSYHPCSHVIAIRALGNWLAFMTSCSILRSCLAVSLNGRGDSFNCYKNGCKIGSDHMVSQLMTAMTYDGNYSPNCGHKWRTTCITILRKLSQLVNWNLSRF